MKVHFEEGKLSLIRDSLDLTKEPEMQLSVRVPAQPSCGSISSTTRNKQTNKKDTDLRN